MADIGSVWAAGSWSTSAWAAGTWADASTAVAEGGPVYAVVNGVVVAPANSTTAANTHWMWVNGTTYIPTLGSVRPALPRERS